jgi:hypothetical protein
MKIVILIALLAIASPAMAQKEEVTAGDLTTICQSTAPAPKLPSTCLAMMYHILGAMDLESFSCMPPNGDRAQQVWYIARLINLSLKVDQRMGNLPATVLVRRAVRVTYCHVDHD